MSQPAVASPDERIYVDWADGNFAWHFYRYVWALPYVFGRRVLDLGCGAGFGTHLLSCASRHVVGADYDGKAIAECDRLYGQNDRLRYVRMDATAPAFLDHSFDVVISFEVLEHMSSARLDAYLSGIRRVLAQDGVALFSTPNRLVEKPHLESVGIRNDYHVNSVSPSELRTQLRSQFSSVQVLGQKPVERRAKRWLKAVDLFNLRHRLLSSRSKSALDRSLSGGLSSYRPALDAIEITPALLRQSGILLAVCRR